MAEMNEDAKRWVEALLSGNYKQGRECLRNTRDEFCCLGVAADLIAPWGWSERAEERRTLKLYRDDDPEPIEVKMWRLAAAPSTVDADLVAGDQILPDALWERLTAGAPNPVQQQDIAGLNDTGKSFEWLVENMILPMWQDAEEGESGAA